MRILTKSHRVNRVLIHWIVLVFALLIFLSGYIHQQRTVSNLLEANKPRIPKPPASAAVRQPESTETQLLPSRLFGGKREGHVAFTDFGKVKGIETAEVNWKRLAHVQLVRSHHDMCNAIMVLAELHRLKSPARRILLFPQAWAIEKKAQKGDISDPFMGVSKRLMKVAARRYGVELRPVSPLIKSSAGEEQDVYSLASAYALTDLDRVLSIETPGLIVDASPLDAVLAFTETAPFAMLHDTRDGDGVHAEDLFLMEPSASLHSSLTKQIRDEPLFNDTLLSGAFPDPLLLESSSEDSALIRSIGILHEAGIDAEDSSFKEGAFLSDVSYIRFSDPKLPGPEYDVPWTEKVAARPKNKDADWTWTKLYGDFAYKRREICGLDLEFWRP